MTASNLGARFTGWGFAIFAIGALFWALVGFLTDQTGLLLTNIFLLVVDLFGVWRWLGHQARIEEGSSTAAVSSRQHADIPTLVSGGWLLGAEVKDRDDKLLGHIVDFMLACEKQDVAYLVLSEGGVAGAGEILRAISGRHFQMESQQVRCCLSTEEVRSVPAIPDNAWPAIAPEPSPVAVQRPAEHR